MHIKTRRRNWNLKESAGSIQFIFDFSPILRFLLQFLLLTLVISYYSLIVFVASLKQI